jgi:hypothetical protein
MAERETNGKPQGHNAENEYTINDFKGNIPYLHFFSKNGIHFYFYLIFHNKRS